MKLKKKLFGIFTIAKHLPFTTYYDVPVLSDMS